MKRFIRAVVAAVAMVSTRAPASADPPAQAQNERACVRQHAPPGCGAIPSGWVDNHDETLVRGNAELQQSSAQGGATS